ncbi:MAG: thioredoxin [Pseudoxanthomonas sp.]|nr:thioredoxin [Pseudoxanthomonas sp.]
MSEHIVHVGETDFQAQVLEAGEPVLVDFWAEWCGPCKAIAPLLDELADEYAGRLKVAKLNVDQAQRLAVSYNVRSIPTLIVFRDGKPHATQIGLSGNARTALRQFVDKAIA